MKIFVKVKLQQCIISVILLITEIIGVQIDLKNIDTQHPNYIKLIDIIRTTYHI